MTNDKDHAYWERNQLVALLSHIFPSHLCLHPQEDKEWESDWRNIVCIHTPAGQACWHIHDSEKPDFEHLPIAENHWDGHTTEEKYARLRRIIAAERIAEDRNRFYRPPLLVALPSFSP